MTAGADRSDVAAWNELLAARHSEYRHAIAPLGDPVSIVCVTSRPECIDSLLDAVAAQTHPVEQLVLVANSERFDDVDLEQITASRDDDLPEVTVLRRPPDTSLGACLNDGIDRVASRFVAKFDDDDHYGPNHLADSMRAHSYAGAGVVGKHTYYARLVQEDRTVLRFPTHEFTYTPTLAGGTLVIDRGRTGDLRFCDIDLGEDRAFIQACLRRGVPTFSCDRFSFLQIRSGDNTWQVAPEVFLTHSIPIEPSSPSHVIDR